MKRVAYDRDWEFYENEESNSFVFGSVKGEMVDLPHDFIVGKSRSADASGGAANGYFGNGQGVYKKTLIIPEEWEGKTVLMDVDGAYMNLEIMVNNTLVGMHPYGYTPYQADLTQALRPVGRKNKLKLITQSRQPSSRWYSGGGLYRDVCLWVGGPVYVKPWDIFVSTPSVSGEKAVVRMETEITGTDEEQVITVCWQVADASGKIAAQVEKELKICGKLRENAELTVEKPVLWELDNPYLYTYKVILKKDGEVLDTAEDDFGIRTIEVDAENGFRLNGKSLNLKGGCVHHDNGFLGACAYPKAEERKMRILKAAGYNTVRISHYPPSLELLKVCDRIGMLLMDETFDVWRLGKMPMDYHIYFEDWWERDTEYMVRRDRNHPCVITYSIGNEITERDGSNDGAEWSKKLTAKVRELDDTRFVLSAVCGVFPENEEDENVIGGGGGNFDINLALDDSLWNKATKEYCEPLDIVGYNYLKDIYEESHKMFPERVMLGTETHSFLTYEYWEKVEKLPYVIGDCIWAAVDYMGEVGVGKVYWENDHEAFSFMTPYPWRTSWQSDIDLTGEQRPQSVYREIMWGNTARSGIFTTHPKHFGESFNGTNWHWFDVNDCWCFDDQWVGKPVQVDIYGAGDEAEFVLNGKSLGRRTFDRLIASMDINYEPGVLCGVVYKDGKEISRSTITTPGKAAKLIMIPEDEVIRADGKDLAYVRIVMEDADGNRLTQDKSEIKVKTEGVGTFLAVGSADPCTEDQITADTCHLYRGSAIVIMKSRDAGEMKIAVSAAGVEDGSCVVRAE
jgi:beta-galactosidase